MAAAAKRGTTGAPGRSAPKRPKRPAAPKRPGASKRPAAAPKRPKRPPPLALSAEATLVEGDALAALRRMPARAAQAVITSPPYWGLRDYGAPGQIGLEGALPDYIEALREVFREARRVLRADGTLWLNSGDGYTSGGRARRAPDRKHPAREMATRPATPEGLKPKDLLGIPWRLAFALQADGWRLRADVIWSKPNAMPESVRDRPTRSHEYLFMLTPGARCFYDREAAVEPGASGARAMRTVWSVRTRPGRGAHPAAFPPALVEPCVRASTRPGDLVLDPFAGSGTVGLVARRLGRRFAGVELKREYAEAAARRLEAEGAAVARADCVGAFDALP